MIRDERFKAVLQDPQFPVQIDIGLNGIILEAIRRSVEDLTAVRSDGGAEWLSTPHVRTLTLLITAPQGRSDEARDIVERFVLQLRAEIHNRHSLLICSNDGCMRIGFFNSRIAQPQRCRACGRGVLLPNRV